MTSGDRFEGSWSKGLKQGKGILYKTITGDRFESSWSNDVRENKGVLVYANGDKYEGEFEGEWKRSGKQRYVRVGKW